MKQNFISEQVVIDEMKKAIVETLGGKEETIKPESSLINDIGAESLDFLDINYRLEQSFGIKMARHFILEHIEEMFGEGSAIDENNQLTDKAIELLKVRFEDDLPDLNHGADVDEVPALITVQSITSGVMDILNSLPEKCACGNSAWKLDKKTRIKCGSCEEYAVFANGDDLIKEWLKNVQKEKNVF